MTFKEKAESAVDAVFAALGAAGTYSPKNGDPSVACQVRFVTEEGIDSFGQLRVVQGQHVIDVPSAQVPNPQTGDEFEIEGQSYRVKDGIHHPDRLKQKWRIGLEKI